MSLYAIDCRSIPAEELPVNPAEVASRLHTTRGYTDETIEACRAQLMPVLDCRFSAIRVPVSYPGGNWLDCGFASFESATLIRNLQGCTEAFVWAVTVGIGVDRLLARLALTSQARHFITDALASAAAEAACDRAEELIRGTHRCRLRFSPGFGDLSLELQPQLLDAVNARKLLGISLNKSLLMSPMKSVTAIMGIIE